MSDNILVSSLEDWLPPSMSGTDTFRGLDMPFARQYGPALPEEMRLERWRAFLNRCQDVADYKRAHPDPVIVHPDTFNHRVEQGLIDKEGNCIWGEGPKP